MIMNRDRETGLQELDQVVGLSRGFPKKGESIEVGRETLAARLRAESPERQKPFPVYIIAKDKANYLDLPLLVEGVNVDHWAWTVRYDPVTGAVWTSRWQKRIKMEETPDKKNMLAEADKFVVFGEPEGRDVDLKALPKSWKVARLVPQNVWDGVEAAMRQSDELKHDYGISNKDFGVERDQVAQLFKHIQALSIEYIKGDVTKESLGILLDSTSKLFEEQGLGGVTDPTKKLLLDSLIRSVHEDSLGRVNPLVARILLRSSYLNNVRREITAGLVTEKTKKVFSLLYAERNTTRILIKSVISAVKFLTHDTENPVFSEDPKLRRLVKLTNQEITGARRVLSRIVKRSLLPVRLAPYLLPSRLAEAIMTSTSMKNKKEIIGLRKALAVGGAEGLLDELSVEDYIMRRNTEAAYARLIHARDVLNAVLEDPQNKVYTVFSHQPSE